MPRYSAGVNQRDGILIRQRRQGDGRVKILHELEHGDPRLLVSGIHRSSSLLRGSFRHLAWSRSTTRRCRSDSWRCELQECGAANAVPRFQIHMSEVRSVLRVGIRLTAVSVSHLDIRPVSRHLNSVQGRGHISNRSSERSIDHDAGVRLAIDRDIRRDMGAKD